MNILRLKELLNEKGIQNKDLADKIGVTPTTISNITQGNNFPKPETLLKIAEALDIDIRELFVSTKKKESEIIYVRRDEVFIEAGCIDKGSL
ncbi:helix-turn-helix transcriptional regulator [Elizabethkingia anophelis]|uniref:helix-turn-helix domain-containing protein n=1 Tax=Elizabethkingia anophelis TaxID=1117645 RepID=UPI000BA8C6AE|nr:helix-turn-helix transcriptional regulator [Elizabethkingia anophelis]ASV77951.1 XRE family transcriptional regulator [Elizabethkingia anophelis]MCL1648260.1 helix-turn-helix transcriptional regulator [Elizabethkingia anophelis]MCL1683654.1 helix-turn-helix transcriptional regulator [Elizabethkingia anophelis]MDV3460762.1 transcriptional regulator [Elizabethkingia anophelis]MDV3571633.1 transcriptional regulator [Elizabethkingia anophelis]